MGRPPLGKRAMSATELQRRWRQRKRLGLVGRADDWPPPGGYRDERPDVADDRTAEYQARIEDLTLQLERARQQRDQAQHELELAAGGAKLRPVGLDHPGGCSVCLRRRDQVKAMFTNTRRYYPFCICNECADEVDRACKEFIAEQERHA